MTEEGKIPKLRMLTHLILTLRQSGSKVKSGGARKRARLLTTRHKFMCFDVTSPVDIDCARCCGRKYSVTHRVLKSHIYFNIMHLIHSYL